MIIAVEGCTHGALSEIYQALGECEARSGQKVDLLLCCGDFQSTRNLADLRCMACPDKYKDMGSFYRYYTGELVAPVLTLFIGGNHEASNYLQELPYGGWVAPRIYYLGYAGVVRVGGLKIGGLSGIYKGHDFLKGHFERPPYDQSAQRSAYHVRNLEAFRLRQMRRDPPSLMLSHDWPQGVEQHGDVEQLLRFKPHFRSDVAQGRLGSPPAMDVLQALRPAYWFAGHLHCKFAAAIEHAETETTTKFLSLDKCLPGRRFLQVLTVGPSLDAGQTPALEYDPAWLAILRSTDHLLSVGRGPNHMPGPGYSGRHAFEPTAEELAEVERIFERDFRIPDNFEVTVPAFDPRVHALRDLSHTPQPSPCLNPQTVALTTRLGIANPSAMLMTPAEKLTPDGEPPVTHNPDEIDLGQSDEDDADTPPAQRSALVLPAPKFVPDANPIEAASATTESTESTDFVIDTKPQPMDQTATPETDQSPKKTLKRRNQAIYTPQDE